MNLWGTKVSVSERKTGMGAVCGCEQDVVPTAVPDPHPVVEKVGVEVFLKTALKVNLRTLKVDLHERSEERN